MTGEPPEGVKYIAWQGASRPEIAINIPAASNVKLL
jgi:hypothetical protein